MTSTEIPDILECVYCENNKPQNEFSKKQLKRYNTKKGPNCKECTALQQEEIITNTPNSVKSIKLKTELEIVTPNKWSGPLNDQLTIEKELSKLVPRNNGNGKILVLDLHGTVDLFFNDEIALNSLQNMRNLFDFVIVLSFVGKGMSERSIERHNVKMSVIRVDENSKRYSVGQDIQKLLNDGIIDFGILVFQRGPAKGWVCDTIRKVYDKDILFADDEDDHLEAVKKMVPQRNYLAGIHKSDPNNPSELYNWIVDNSF